MRTLLLKDCRYGMVLCVLLYSFGAGASASFTLLPKHEIFGTPVSVSLSPKKAEIGKMIKVSFMNRIPIVSRIWTKAKT